MECVSTERTQTITKLADEFQQMKVQFEESKVIEFSSLTNKHEQMLRDNEIAHDRQMNHMRTQIRNIKKKYGANSNHNLVYFYFLNSFLPS